MIHALHLLWIIPLVASFGFVLGAIGDEPVALGGIATPVNEQDAVNKEYVDNIVGDIETLLAAL